MEYNEENVDKVAQKIVNDMDLDSIMAYVYDDLCATMWKDDAHFIELLEMYGINEEDFVDSKNYQRKKKVSLMAMMSISEQVWNKLL